MDEIKQFLTLFDDYKKSQQLQRIRGLNNFNIFTTLLDKTDEVRLHSRFIHFLLDPTADHYQGSLFLELFLRECKLSGYFETVENCKVYKEYSYIDLYVTDGEKHLIIENKINADDQPLQLQKYIDTIKAENSDDSDFSDHLVVVYLSLDRDRPKPVSLGDFKLVDSLLVRREQKYKFLSITYKSEVTNWIAHSFKQVSNITNLSVGLNQYREVILKLYGNYEAKVMKLKDYIDGNVEREKLYETIKSIKTEYESLREDMFLTFFEQVHIHLEAKLKGSGWSVILDKQKLVSATSRGGLPIKIQQSDDAKVVFGFEFSKLNQSYPWWGIVKRSKDVGNLRELDSEYLRDSIKEIDGSLAKSKVDAWWLRWTYYYEGDLFDRIIMFPNEEKAAVKFVEDLMPVFISCKNVIIKCDEVLGKA